MAKNKKGYLDGNTEMFSDYPGVGKVYDKDVAEYTVKHATLFDRIFNPKKIARAALMAQMILFKEVEEPEDKNFKW